MGIEFCGYPLSILSFIHSSSITQFYNFKINMSDKALLKGEVL